MTIDLERLSRVRMLGVPCFIVRKSGESMRTPRPHAEHVWSSLASEAIS